MRVQNVKDPTRDALCTPWHVLWDVDYLRIWLLEYEIIMRRHDAFASASASICGTSARFLYRSTKKYGLWGFYCSNLHLVREFLEAIPNADAKF